MNTLSQSTSLYLQQHADNPVDWWQWDDSALAEARELDIPILLSIGYSACHWCHVMAHESFEDEATAGVMNSLFLNIKVDREERPDLDRVYQLAHQMLSGRGGGWPLTVFLDPQDLTPFFAGTYFPPAPRHGMPPFREVLIRVREWFDTHRDDVRKQNNKLRNAIDSIQQGNESTDMADESVLTGAIDTVAISQDKLNGGFGRAPKFPQAPLLSWLKHQSGTSPSQAVKLDEILRHTLERMASSGLRDHLDGGFFRYCVDADWTIPHFEKMLYDNAQLLGLYAEMAARHQDAGMTRVAEGIADWLLTEMQKGESGFSASIDADADGHEGGYHTWRPETAAAHLEEEEFQLFQRAFGLDSEANFEGSDWHLVRTRSDTELTALSDHNVNEIQAILTSACSKLRAARALRIAPATDPKRLTAWNALTIEGFARAGAALDRPDWLDVAENTLAFVRDTLFDQSELLTVYAAGRAHTHAFLDDYATLLHATMVLLAYRWRPESLELAQTLAETLLERFSAGEKGGFYFTAAGAEAPLGRARPMQDDASPAGNGLAAQALLWLGHLLGEVRYLDAAEGILRAASSDIQRSPLGHASLLTALDEYLHPVTQIILTGTDADQLDCWQKAIRTHDRVHCYAAGVHGRGLPGADKNEPEERAIVARVCRGVHCLPPVESLEDLMSQLQGSD